MRHPLLLLALALTAFAPAASAQLLFAENFPYPAGDLVAGSGGNWVSHSGTTTLNVVASNLTFPAYPSTSGNAANVTGGSGSRQDDNRKFTPVTTGPVYVAALVRVTAAPPAANADYFLHLAQQDAAATGGISTASFRGRVFIQAAGAGLNFGVSKATGTVSSVVFESTERALNTTYLVILKYTIVDGADNDTVQLYVVPQGTGYALEGSLTPLTATDTGTDMQPGAVALRQGGSTYDTIVDGLRVTRSFASIGTAAEDRTHAGAARLDVAGPQPGAGVRVRLVVDVPGAVRLDAFDVLGRHVATLLDGTLGAGEAREVAFGGVAPGVYVLRATGAGFAATRTVALR